MPIGDHERERIAKGLDNNRAMWLAHHDLLTASGSVEEAAGLTLFLERTAHLRRLARSAGGVGGA